MANLSLGFLLMLVGMVSVFVILLIVIYGSNLMILIINKIAPEEVHASANKAEASADPKTMEIITAAISQITGGKGKVASVKRY